MGKVPWHSGFGLTASEHWRHTKKSFNLKVFAHSSTMAGVGNIECAYALETAALHTSPREFFSNSHFTTSMAIVIVQYRV